MPNDPAPADAIPGAVPTRTGSRRPGERRLQILQTLAEMLEHPKAERITTAALARKLDVSEAALYRHFASKAQMFEGLIEFIEQSVFGLINQITSGEENGVKQARRMVAMLLEFAQTNRGMTRVLIGDALVIEDERLQGRMNQLMDRLEASLKQCLKVAVAQGDYPSEEDPAVRASLIMAYIIGRWSRFAKTGFRKSPLEYSESQALLLLS
ncbi:MAG: nucleoid occlusion factor SlmA [Burkholderiaceae bacterium]|jgi:TetR/AcrR family transcriptional regulator